MFEWDRSEFAWERGDAGWIVHSIKTKGPPQALDEET
jgi:hypothetical protein